MSPSAFAVRFDSLLLYLPATFTMDARYFGVLIGLLPLGCMCIPAWPWRRELREWRPYILLLSFFTAVVGLLAVLLVN